MKVGKWIGGGLGWVVGGPIGALLGFAFGSVIDSIDTKKQPQASQGQKQATGRGDFVLSLLVLIAAVMKADGKVVKAELDYVKQYFLTAFGPQAAGEALLMLRDILKKDIPVDKVGWQIKMNMDYSSRLQLIHLLYSVSKADGSIHAREIEIIHYISNRIGVTTKDERSIRAMFVEKADAAYEILEIRPDAGVEDIKKAYRKMAMKYHPDKVSHLGEEFQISAKEKFQKVNEAYEKIKRDKGFS
ncbi:MAG: DnaJ domain-containing protein [Bacteroidota bacterium]